MLLVMVFMGKFILDEQVYNGMMMMLMMMMKLWWIPVAIICGLFGVRTKEEGRESKWVYYWRDVVVFCWIFMCAE